MKVKQLLLAHAKQPCHYGKIPATHIVEGSNVGCRDRIVIYASLEDDERWRFSFEAEGCTLSRACASILLEQLNGSATCELTTLTVECLIDVIGETYVKSRFKCATLALTTIQRFVSTVTVSTD